MKALPGETGNNPILQHTVNPMRQKISGTTLLALTASLMPLFLFAQTAQSQKRDYAALASELVETAQIAPDQTVVIWGGQHTIPLMEETAVQVTKKGGRPAVMLSTDRIVRSSYMDRPMEQLGKPDPLDDWITGNAAVYIGMPGVEDPSVYDAIPEERFAKVNEAYAGWWAKVNASPIRLVFVAYPTQAEAAAQGVDFATYEQMHWDALAADYGAIAAKAEAITERLKPGAEVHVTTPSGTDFTFTVGDRPVFNNDGRISEDEARSSYAVQRYASFPGGSLSFAPVETSASGRVVVPGDRCKGEALTDVSFEFKSGIVQNFEAKQGADCFRDVLAAYSGPKDRFGWITFGLNPAMKVMEEGEAHYWPSEAAGMVTIGVGDNEVFGGDNKQTGSFAFPLTHATVEIGGETIIKDGKLVVGASR